ncbi:NAD(P)-binding protein [Fontibacillus sp. BL9]|uniref:NAD(P)/FAD-dependent oxidoreductase n=1 Tax=Fontibacillus sp. BL9 TaxID=3389971 RepID=UPI00397E5866
MKVAIMGAGLSGLACAIRLEQLGVSPDIFEKRGSVGDRFVNGEVLLTIFSRPVRDEISYLADKYQIYLHPTGNIGEFVISSQHEQAKLSGHMGFCNIRGRHENSFENQLARQVKTKIHFHSERTYEDLVKEYTHVILATGDAEYAAVMKNFEVDLTATLKGATVEGDFSRYRVMCWLDDRYAPKGYGYLIPYSKTEANIVIAFPDELHSVPGSTDEKWKLFFERVCTDLGQNLKVTDRFEVNNYIIGQCNEPRIGNTLFTGNCLGTVMPLFGFGQFPSLLSGIYAAEELCGIGSYIESTRELRESYQNSLTLRKWYEKMDNSQKDKLVKRMNGHWGEKLLTTQMDVLKIISRFLRWGGN